ncbi:c-type cytochrome [Maricaulis maris]|uniref:c-type cytochrome n=1 Tax=Maricaulis maris TaxID=74318 RepID=UPI003A90A6CA
MNALQIASIAVAGLLAAPFANAQDSAAGETVYQSVCKNCHGPTGKGMASFPKLIGQGPEYLSERLTAYRAKESVGPNSALMYPVAGKLSDADIENVVAYITTELE